MKQLIPIKTEILYLTEGEVQKLDEEAGWHEETGPKAGWYYRDIEDEAPSAIVGPFASIEETKAAANEDSKRVGFKPDFIIKEKEGEKK